MTRSALRRLPEPTRTLVAVVPDAGELLFPAISVVCPACAGDLAVGAGLDPFETLWMHDLECPEAAFAEAVFAEAVFAEA